MSGRVQAARTGRVVELTIADPERRNALSLALLDELGSAVSDQAATGVAALVITGAGGCFSAGANLSDLDGTIADLAYDEALERTLDRLRGAPFPVIAAIEGACLGAGFGLAMACDVRVASATAFFEVPAARLGLLYNPAAIAAMRKSLAPQTLTRLLVVGERLGAAAAEAAGIVAGVVPAGAALDRARALAERAMANVPAAMAAAKGLLGALDGEGFDLAHWNALRAEILDSPERREAVAAAKAALGR